MTLSDDGGDGGKRQSARSKRKAKEKANARKRAAAGNVVNPYAGSETDGKEEEPVQAKESAKEAADDGEDDTRPKTSHSDASGETLVGGGGAHESRAPTPAPTTQNPRNNDPTTTEPEEPKTTASEWTYDDLPDTNPPDSFTHNEDPDEPLTEAEIRHKEILDWTLEQKGHHYSLKRSTVDRIVEFIYGMKYAEDRAEWMRECRLVVWRCAVRCNFWWVNPDTNTPTGKPLPVTAPTGVYESNFALFVSCAAERLDRIGRDLPDAEYVAQIETALRLFFRRVEFRNLTRSLEHLSFLLMVDEEQARFLTREGFQSRMRMCFDAEGKTMNWGGMGVVSMGEWPVRKTDPPLRQDVVWEDLLVRFGL